MRTGRLNVAKISRTTLPGRYADGGCLYLVVTATKAKQWIARLTIHGKQTDLGLGGLSYVTLAEAREEAAKLRKISRTGGDPRVERKRESLTFSDAARRVHAALRPTWKNEKHAETWLATVETYANPVFGARPIELVRTADVLRVLSPIWTEKHETAKRLRQRISTVFDWAKGAGHYPHENPVNGIKKALPTVKRNAEHMAALPWQDVPDFVAELETRPGVSARALEFIILTAARSGEARGARWSEISSGTWTVPAERMKRSIEHRVPLSPDALRVVEAVRYLDGDLLFPSNSRNSDGRARPQSDMVFKALMTRMGRSGFTVHGFRSSFRDWCSDSSLAPRELAEAALSHASGNEVERAYARSDHFERRRSLMEDWARFAFSKRTDSAGPQLRTLS